MAPGPGTEEAIDKDEYFAGVLRDMTKDTNTFQTNSKAPKAADDNRMDFSDIESMADDEVGMDLDESEEEVMALPTIDEMNTDYEIPTITKASGEVVLKLTELYAPLPATQALYNKQYQIQRVCKANATISDYHDYLRSLREYKTQLSEIYKSIRLRELGEYEEPQPSNFLMSYQDYEKRVLLKKLRAIERELHQVKSDLPSLLTKPVKRFPRNIFYPINHEDFTKRIIWTGPCDNPNKKPAHEHIMTIKEKESVFNVNRETLQKGEPLLYINNKVTRDVETTKQQEVENSDSLGAFLNNLLTTSRKTEFKRDIRESLPISNFKIAFGFAKKKARPGKIEASKPFSLYKQEFCTHWGEEKVVEETGNISSEISVEPKRSLFVEQLPETPSILPTHINTEFIKSTWEKLVFGDFSSKELQEIHKNYSKPTINLADASILVDTMDEKLEERKPERDEDQSDVEASEYSKSLIEDRSHRKPATSIKDTDQGDLESKAAKSMISEASSRTGTLVSTNMPDPLGRFSTTRITMLKHAQPSYDYPFLKTDWIEYELRNLHKPDLTVILKFEGSPKKWRVRSALKDRFKAPGSPEPEISRENVTAYAILKTAKQLSLKRGKFILTEYIEKRPPLLSNLGMASKLKRYIKGSRASLQEYPHYLGSLGLPVYLENNQKIPLLGQLEENQAISVFENNMYRSPVYSHNPRYTDFMLVRTQGRRGKPKFYLREIDYIYSSGQIEPKMEVFIPKSRNTNTFQQKRIQAYILHTLIQNNNRVTLQELVQAFPSQNEGILRKLLKGISCEQQKDGSWTCTQLPSEQEVRELITPENICEYESMLTGQLRLQDKGISITSIDKVPCAIQKLKKELNDKRTSYLANYIEEELIVTPWNLTSSYITTKQNKGMMRIEGIGDPTCGHCGYSFVRLPMKLPQNDKTSVKNDPSKYLPTNRMVTGTSADLRTLTMDKAKKLLLKLGKTDKEIEGLPRWNRVSLLRQLSSQAAAQGVEGSINKYARGMRVTTKMQKEKYQKKINEIFQRQIRMLGETREYYSDHSSDSEDERIAKALTSQLLRPKEEKQKKQINWEEDLEEFEKEQLEELKNSKLKMFQSDIPDVPPLELPKTEGKKRILKRVTKIPNLDGSFKVRVEFLTDEIEIDNYLKKLREEEIKGKKVDRNKKALDTIEAKFKKASEFATKKKKKKHDMELLNVEERKKEKKIREEKKRLEKQKEYTELCINKLEQGQTLWETGTSKMTCSKCGMVGHMKTNRKKCPMYATDNVEPSVAEQEGLVKGDGNKLLFNIKDISKISPKKKDEKSMFSSDYARPRTSSSRRRRYLDNPYDEIAFKLIRFDHTRLFIQPVKKEVVPDYYEKIQNPIDLETIRSKGKRGEYKTAQDFINDLKLMIDNSDQYNGPDHEITAQARCIYEEGLKLLKERELLVNVKHEDQDQEHDQDENEDEDEQYESMDLDYDNSRDDDLIIDLKQFQRLSDLNCT
jgi:hypothetical protein